MRFALGSCALALAMVTACSSSKNNNSNGDGGSVSSSDAGNSSGDTTSDGGSETHAEPPPPGPATPADGTTDVTIAISKLYLGDTDRDGTADTTNGWKNYGYDIDGKISTATSTDLCKPADGASPKNVYPDGLNGIDNSFGKLILPIVLGISSDETSQVNAGLAAGGARLLVTLHKLGGGANYNPLPSSIYQSEALGSAPKYDGTDVFLVDPASLTTPSDITTPKAASPNAYVTNDVWVSADKVSMTITPPTSGFAFTLPIQVATISATLSPDRKTATLGTISGVIPVAQLVAQLQAAAGSFDSSLCSGPTIDSILTQITQAADILQDGTQDPTQTCDGISIGLGFDGAVVQLGSIGAPVPLPPNPCDDGGTEAGP